MSGAGILDDRARGWLRHMWKKATTPDDWSSAGEPHPWWDRDSTPPTCAFPRFDLFESAYALTIMSDVTPAWREVYARIADGLVARHTTFWAAIDWLTLIGPDPRRDSYPPEWHYLLPEPLRGRYEGPGWTANGIEPWGLQPDPIGADGNLFFRGFLNLLLGLYRYIAGDDKWDRPFPVTGYREREFEWSHSRITEFLTLQMEERPQGPHCENTKIYPHCVSGAGAGLQPPVNDVLVALNSLRFAGPGIDHVFDDLQLFEPPDGAGAHEAEPRPLRHELRLQGVTARYPTAHRDALRDVDLTIRRGEFIGVVGPTGGGKSTLVDVMLGLLEPAKSSVRDDGEDIRRCAEGWHASIEVSTRRCSSPTRPCGATWRWACPRRRSTMSACSRRWSSPSSTSS